MSNQIAKKFVTKRSTVVIADDHPMFRTGVRQAIQDDGQFEITGEAGNGSDAFRFITERSPDVAVLDINMPGMTGLAIAREVILRELPTKIVLLTMHDDQEWFDEAMDIGVKGYVLKEVAPEDIVTAIHTVASGKYYISSKLANRLVERHHELEAGRNALPELDTLTATERKILKLISEGKSSKEIGDTIFISPRTVDNHRSNIARKLGIQGSFSLLRYAIEIKKYL